MTLPILSGDCLYNQMDNATQRLVTQAEQIMVNLQDLGQVEQFKALLNTPALLPNCLEAIRAGNDVFLFVYCSTMLQMMQKGEHNFQPAPSAQENIVQLADSDCAKQLHYAQVLEALMGVPANPNRPAHITRSLMDLTALALKSILEDTGGERYLQGLIRFYLPQVVLNQNFVGEMEERESPYEPNPVDLTTLNLVNFQYFTTILASTVDYMIHQTEGESYYEFRRHIYVFRNNYLPLILSACLDLFTSLFKAALVERQAYRYLEMLMPLVEAVWMFPFAMSLHESDSEEEPGEAITGAYGGDVYFPGYFRPILSSQSVLTAIGGYIRELTQSRQPFERIRTPLNILVKVAGRLCAASSYSFRNDPEKSLSRQCGVQVLTYLCDNFVYFEDYYISSILESLSKTMTMSDRFLHNNKLALVGAINRFLIKVVRGLPIVIADGKRSPVAKAFELITVMEDVVRERANDDQRRQIKGQFQLILEALMERVVSAEADEIVKNFGYNIEGEIQRYEEFFHGMVEAVLLDLDRNLSILESINMATIGQGAAVMWLHFCAILLPRTQSDSRQVNLIRFYSGWASDRPQLLASLHFMRVLADCILSDMSDGQPTSNLWVAMQREKEVHFGEYLDHVIAICTGNFMQENLPLVRYSLEFFKMVFSHLKRSGDSSFELYYERVGQLVGNLDGTIFNLPKYYKVRRELFGVIAVVWMNDNKVDYLYKIHDMVLAKLEQSVEGLLRYMIDVTGIVENIDRQQSYEVMAQLMVDRLGSMLAQYLPNDQLMHGFLSDESSSKIFMQMVLAFLTDLHRKLYFTTHTPIPQLLHNLFSPYLLHLVQNVRPLPRHTAAILEKMGTLVTTNHLIDFTPAAKELRELNPQEYERLVKFYFENIQRVGELGALYPLIEEKIDFMTLWWEEAIMRGFKPNVSLRGIVEARLWQTSKQMEQMAKMVFFVGESDRQYWDVQGKGERQFVREFMESFK